MLEHQRAVWTMSSTASSSYNLAMQELTGNIYTTSEQHKDLSTSRVNRDDADHDKVAANLDSFTPFSDDTSSCNIVIGVNANDYVDAHDMFTIGNDIVRWMVTLFSHIHTKGVQRSGH